MDPIQSHERRIGRFIRRRGWSLGVLVAMIAIVLSFDQGGTVQASSANLAYVTSADDLDADCDGTHALSGTHCCAGVACAGYAQHEAVAAASILLDGGYFLPAGQPARISRTLRPTSPPPQA